MKTIKRERIPTESRYATKPSYEVIKSKMKMKS